MKKQSAIRDGTREQIQTLVAKANKTFEDLQEIKVRINTVLLNVLGEKYSEPSEDRYWWKPENDGHHYQVKKYGEFNDKCSNNLLGFNTITYMLEHDYEKMTPDQIAESLGSMRDWPNQRSDKPTYEAETRPKALDRTLGVLETFVQDHRAAFGDSDWNSLQQDLTTFRNGITKDVPKYAAEADRIYKIIVSHCTSLQ